MYLIFKIDTHSNKMVNNSPQKIQMIVNRSSIMVLQANQLFNQEKFIVTGLPSIQLLNPIPQSMSMSLYANMIQNIIINPLSSIPTNLSMQNIPLDIYFIFKFFSIKYKYIIILHIKKVLHLAFPNLIIRTIQIYSPTYISFDCSNK